jgi:hypothetical protein
MKLFSRGKVTHLAALASGLAIGFAVVGTALAGTHPTDMPRAHAATMHHYSIAASAFAPDSLDNTAQDYFNRWDPSTLSNTSNGRCFNAGVVLPNGATIHSVWFFYTNGATNAFYGELNRQNLLTHTFRFLTHFTSKPTGTSPKYTITKRSVTSHNVVVTGRYAYSVGVCPAGDATFTGVMVNYTG